jgi:hypothetical protein
MNMWDTRSSHPLTPIAYALWCFNMWWLVGPRSAGERIKVIYLII